MIDKDITPVGAGKAQALWRWIKQALWRWIKDVAQDIDDASRVLHRIQYDRPWETGAVCGDDPHRSRPVN